MKTARFPRWLESGRAAAVLLALFYVALLVAARDKSATFDEPGHAAAGYAYWTRHDFRIDPENGVLPQRWIALPLLIGDGRFPSAESAGWRAANSWVLGDAWLNRLGNDSSTLVNRGRAAAACFAVALGVLIWSWTRELFGARAALVALLAFGLNPGVLANGALMTSDMASALFFTLSLRCFAAMLADPTARRIACSGLAFGALCLTKFSAVLMVPVTLALAALHVGRSRHALPRLAGAAAAHAVIAVAMVWAAYDFRFSAAPEQDAPAHFQSGWDKVLSSPETRSESPPVPMSPLAPPRLIDFARRHRLLPEAFLYGCAHVWHFSTRPAFFGGRLFATGVPSFFPFVFAVKTPLLFFVLLALGLSAIARGRRWAGVAPLLVFVPFYFAAAIGSGFNLGHRHLLPIYPALFILAGAAALLASRAGHAIVAAIVAALALESVAWFPNYLAYFNGLVRPSHAYEEIADSSLDWGQELPAIRRDLGARPDKRPAFLAYFGVASPRAAGIAAAQIYGFPGFDLQTGAAPRVERLSAGTYYISASLLPPVYYVYAAGKWSAQHEKRYRELQRAVGFASSNAARMPIAPDSSGPAERALVREFDDYRFARLAAFLRRREPTREINYSVLVFELTDADLQQALEAAVPWQR